MVTTHVARTPAAWWVLCRAPCPGGRSSSLGSCPMRLSWLRLQRLSHPHFRHGPLSLPSPQALLSPLQSSSARPSNAVCVLTLLVLLVQLSVTPARSGSSSLSPLMTRSGMFILTYFSGSAVSASCRACPVSAGVPASVSPHCCLYSACAPRAAPRSPRLTCTRALVTLQSPTFIFCCLLYFF